jgi:hypothetical protein
MPEVVAHNKYSNSVVNQAKQKMIRKAEQIDTLYISFPNRKRFWSLDGLRHEAP